MCKNYVIMRAEETKSGKASKRLNLCSAQSLHQHYKSLFSPKKKYKIVIFYQKQAYLFKFE